MAWRIGRKLSAIAELVSAVITGAPLSYNKEKVRANTFEPIMILMMGGVVLFIVLAMLLPIFELNQIPL
jgi:type II secretory pathway component PulF